jgi:hypothetical protein
MCAMTRLWIFQRQVIGHTPDYAFIGVDVGLLSLHLVYVLPLRRLAFPSENCLYLPPSTVGILINLFPMESCYQLSFPTRRSDSRKVCGGTSRIR